MDYLLLLVIQFCWIPAHYGIYGNEIAIKLAKKALELDQTDIHIPLGKGDAISLIKAEVTLRWQEEWESESSARHYHSNQYCWREKNHLKGAKQTWSCNNKVEIGHTGLNSTQAIIGKSIGVCSECKVVEDVNHVLFICKKFDQHRQKWEELDKENDIHNILQEQGIE